MMKKTGTRKSQSTTNLSVTKSCTSTVSRGNNSIVSMFQKQQQKWDSLWMNNEKPVTCAREEEEQHALNTEHATEWSKKSINSQPDLDQMKKALLCCDDKEMILNSPKQRKLSLKRKRISLDDKRKKERNLTSSSSSPLSSLNSVMELALTGQSKKEIIFNSSSSLNSTIDGSSDSTLECRSDAASVSLRRGGIDVNYSDIRTRNSAQMSRIEFEGISSEIYETTTNETTDYYYLDNFLTILNVVLNDEYYSCLFNRDDLDVVDTFRNLLDDRGRRLYVRLFLRKHRWLRRNQISYTSIADDHDLTEILHQLTKHGLLMNVEDLTDLEEAVQCLTAPDLKTLAKSLHINPSSKTALSCAVVSHVRRCDNSNVFCRQIRATEQSVMKRTKTLLGDCFKLTKEKRFLFIRFLLIFGLHNTDVTDDDATCAQQQLFQMFMSQIGKVKYPEYKVLRSSRIFINRNDVISYGEALQIESELYETMERKDYETSLKIYEKIKVTANKHLTDRVTSEAVRHLPLHLRSFTSGAVYVRLLTRGIEVLQFLKRFSDAVKQLEFLLQQDVYYLEHRGRWFDRLALNLDFHLKQPFQALVVIKSSLKDDFVRTGRRLSLLQRAHKICSSGPVKKSGQQSEWSKQFEDDPMNSIRDAPTVTITGRQLSYSFPGSNPLWINNSNEDERNDTSLTLITRVEDVALKHYADNGFPEGLHAEGSTFRCLFSLFLWKILFIDGVEDAFLNSYQTHPLDLMMDQFYKNRKNLIDERLQQISTSSNDELCDEVSNAWKQYKDTLCFGINWQLFRDDKHIEGLVRCLGGVVLAGIIERMVLMMRYVCGGVPDLVVWNTDSCKYKIVEVKGPGDRLSTKQILWIDYLLKLGVDAEVCHVRAVGAKTMSI